VPFILVLVVSLLFKVLDKIKNEKIHALATDIVLWAEEKASKDAKFNEAVIALMGKAKIPRAQAELLIQASFEKLRHYLNSRPKNA
jgi:hypothetical protein